MRASSSQKYPKKWTNSYQMVTDAVISAIEAGAGEWKMPWHRSGEALFRPLRITGDPYTGINILHLWICADINGYSERVWGTYKQWKKLNCQVRKGETSSRVVFTKTYGNDENDPSEKEEAQGDSGKYEGKDFLDLDQSIAQESRGRSFLVDYSVFNADQVEGYKPEMIPIKKREGGPIEIANEFVEASEAKIQKGGVDAFYYPAGDYIQMPFYEQFFATETSSKDENYYSTFLHELIHWTGHEKREARKFGKVFGDMEYAQEELIAELGAAFLCADLGISVEPRPDHAAYIDYWLKILRGDNRAIFRASAQASRAIRYLEKLHEKRIN